MIQARGGRGINIVHGLEFIAEVQDSTEPLRRSNIAQRQIRVTRSRKGSMGGCEERINRTWCLCRIKEKE